MINLPSQTCFRARAAAAQGSSGTERALVRSPKRRGNNGRALGATPSQSARDATVNDAAHSHKRADLL